MTVKFETITPAKAKEYLKSNTKNRKLRLTEVGKYATEMQLGNWVPNTDCIGFDVEGVITNGATRLNAIIVANKPATIAVMRNLPLDARNTVDNGNQRSHAHTPQMAGLGVERDKKRPGRFTKDYSKVLAQGSAYIILHETNRFHEINSISSRISNLEIERFVRVHEKELVTSWETIRDIIGDRPYIVNPHAFLYLQCLNYKTKQR